MIEKVMLEIKNVHKAFGNKQVLKGVDLSVPENSVFGFVGQNGAGKTTTMKAVLGLLPIDEGEILVNKKQVTYGDNITNKYIGYLPDVPEFYGYMTAREYLYFCGNITNMDKSDIKTRTEELLELVGLSHEKHRIGGYSRGMKQRLGIAQALLNRPKLLICDEPTSALDPVGRKEILDVIVEAKKETTVIFSTHILNDVERICDRIALLHDGKIVMSGTIQEVMHYGIKSDGCKANLKLSGVTEDKKSRLMEFLKNENIGVDEFSDFEYDLERIFMEVTAK